MFEPLLQAASRFGVDLRFSCLLAATTGLALHLGYFIRSYHVPRVTTIICLHLLACNLLFIKTVAGLGFLNGAKNSVAISASYSASMFLSISIYRLAFHPLCRFPGPLPAKITKLYGPWLARNKRVHEEFRSLHERHGDFVRVGPNEISVSHIDAMKIVHGPQTECSKKNNAQYESLTFRGEANLNSLSDHTEHRHRRKVWDQALNRTSLASYEAATRVVVKSYLGRLQHLRDGIVDSTLYAKLIAFDNMGRIGYSKDFGSIETCGKGRLLDMVEITFSTLASLGQLTWPLVLLFDMPRFGLQREFEELAVELVDDRMNRSDAGALQDILRAFIQDFQSSSPQAFRNTDILYADSQAILIASTETIACALGFAFFFLARDARLRGQLREAIAAAYGKSLAEEFVGSDLATIELLNAVINETLRMYSPVAVNGPRSTPPQGVEIGGKHIPGNVHIYTPPHVYHRSAKYFRNPDDFIAERWTTQPELIIDRRAFQPFSSGRYDCVGKALALNVLRLTLAYTVWHYDFELAPGEDQEAFLNGSLDLIIVKPAALRCVFTRLNSLGKLDETSAGCGKVPQISTRDGPELRQRSGQHMGVE